MRLRERVDATCPFCGRVVSMGVAVLEPGDDKVPGTVDGADVLTHEDPACALFLHTSAEEFVASVRKRRAKKRGAA